MMRMINFLLIALMLLGAGVVYDLKYEAEKATAKVARINRKIDTERDAIATLKAEWSLLNQPKRLQELTERHHAYLELDPLAPTQIGSIDDIPFKPVVPVDGATKPVGTPGAPGAAPAGAGASVPTVTSAALTPRTSSKGSVKLAAPEKTADRPVSIGKFLDRLPSAAGKGGGPTTTGSIPKPSASAPMMLMPLPPASRPATSRPSEPTKVIR